MHFNLRGAWSIYTRELMRAMRTAYQSILSAGVDHFALFHRVWLCHRQPDARFGRGRIWCIYCARIAASDIA